MTPARKALWFIESFHSGANREHPIGLDEIAAAVGVSRFHLSRAFATAFGMPVMRYVRGRRLTEAARMLAAGAPEILAVAIEAGYGSHEAFTRAFREEFGRTPEEFREGAGHDEIPLLEPIRMKPVAEIAVAPPRLVDTPERLFAGVKGACDPPQIPSLWMKFTPFLGHIRSQTGNVTYGVIAVNGDAMDYYCAVEVTSETGLPPEFSTIRMPAQRYAVFSHGGHVSEISGVWASIWNTALAANGLEATGGPDFERYDGAVFNARTGAGGYEIWVAVRERA